ncbi:MAG TPA: hypothetical protein PL009_12945 [Flavipsychrobacter sp.]|nr:hypothetical protein [Flavipsychrobacter sp.]
MKATIVILISALFCNMAQAQQFTAIAYTAEGNNYYQIANATSQSAVPFYSEAGGGN